MRTHQSKRQVSRQDLPFGRAASIIVPLTESSHRRLRHFNADAEHRVRCGDLSLLALTRQRGALAVLFLAPSTTEEDPSDLTSAVWRGVGERWLDPFAVEPSTGSRLDRADTATVVRSGANRDVAERGSVALRMPR
jgi:hypothetical protein